MSFYMLLPSFALFKSSSLTNHASASASPAVAFTPWMLEYHADCDSLFHVAI
jgi:hypothetical protein